LVKLVASRAAALRVVCCWDHLIDAVNDIENLTNGLGRKIWQKITIIGALEEKA
jgi:hypothetical protein